MTARNTEEIIEFSRRVPGFYEEVELRRLLELTRTLPANANIVEIGVECGRSASIFLQCPENWQRLWLIDDRSHNAAFGRQWLSKILFESGIGHHGVRVYEVPSAQAAQWWSNSLPDEEIDLLHIDADHGPAVWDDCRLWLPKVRVGGYAVFHDYARKGADGQGDVFPEVTRAINTYLRNGRELGTWLLLDTIDTQFAAQRVA